MIRLIEVTDINNGFFTLFEKNNVEWLPVGSGATIDYDYYFNISGQKPVSPLIRSGISNGKVSKETMDRAVAIAKFKYLNQWNKLYKTMVIDYKPLTNYNSTETVSETNDITKTASRSDESSSTDTTKGTNTRKDSVTGKDIVDNDSTRKDTINQKEIIDNDTTNTDTIKDGTTKTVGTVTGEETDSVEKGIYGFNTSKDAVKSDSQLGTNSNTKSVDNTVTVNEVNTNVTALDQTTTNENTLSRTDTTDTTTTKESKLDRTDSIDSSVTSSETKTRTDNDTTKEVKELTKTKEGMVAYTTFQEMLEKEREVWRYDFFKQVYKDVDKILTLPIYEVDI